jgi:hypothetical protein
MPNSPGISQRAGNCVLKYLLVCATFPLLINSACPTKEPPLPPRLGKPVITLADIREARSGNSYSVNFHVSWTPPSEDSVHVRFYKVLRWQPTDSSFGIVSPLIADSITDYYLRLDKTNFPIMGFDSIVCEVLAIDSLYRPSDTSESYTLLLAPQPKQDSILNARCCKWTIQGCIGQIESYSRIWDLNHTIIWTSNTDLQMASNGEPVTSPLYCMNSAPQDTGIYFYGVYLTANLDQYSLKIGSFHVP